MVRGGLTAVLAGVVGVGALGVDGARASGPVDVEVLFAAPADVPPGPLVFPPSPLRVTLFGGQPRIADDGSWYALYVFPLINPNDPREFTRDYAMFKDGLPLIREGLQLPNDPGFLPAADFTFSQQPFFDIAIAGDGTVGQVIRGTDQFTTLPDGSPDPADIDFEDNKFDMVLLDGAVVLRGGVPLDVVPGIAPPDNTLQGISTAKPADAGRVLVLARLGEGGTFDPEVPALFEITDPGAPTQSETLRLTTDDANPVPQLGLNLSSLNGNEEDIDYNASGSILIGVDIEGAPTDEDGAILYYDGPAGTYQLLAREGDPSPLPGRVYDGLFNNPLALNDAGDTAFLASVDGDFDTDGILVVNGAVVAQEDMIVGTAVPGPLQLGFANANIEMDDQGNILWYGAWNKEKALVCPDNDDITSSFVIYEGIFLNDEVLIEGGVTEVHDVTIDGTFFPTLVVKDLPNTGAAGFHVSPDGRWLIVHALLAEPDPDICAFSINNDATPVAQVLLRVDLDALAPAPCPGDADGSGAVDVNDITYVVNLLGQAGPDGDADGSGAVDVNDITFVVNLLGTPCP